MTDYLRNHTVPKFLLKRWSVLHQGIKRHWILDCATGTIGFEDGEKAKFAIINDRYVPTRNAGTASQLRDVFVEKWFGGGESDMATVLRCVESGEPFNFSEGEAGGFVQAAILLGFRSNYEFEAVAADILTKEPHLSSQQVGEKVVDRFVGMYSKKLRQFNTWDFVMMTDLGSPLLICDRPLFDMTLNHSKTELVMLPLAPDILLLGTPPEDRSRGVATISRGKGSQKLADMANGMTVKRARQFIVGEYAALTQLLPSFAAGAFAARVAEDTFPED